MQQCSYQFKEIKQSNASGALLSASTTPNSRVAFLVSQTLKGWICPPCVFPISGNGNWSLKPVWVSKAWCLSSSEVCLLLRRDK